MDVTVVGATLASVLLVGLVLVRIARSYPRWLLRTAAILVLVGAALAVARVGPPGDGLPVAKASAADVDVTPPCAEADRLLLAGEEAEARELYRGLLASAGSSAPAEDCATAGLALLDAQDVDAVAAVTRGADNLWRSVTGGVLDSPAGAGPLAWLLVALAALLGYRRLEVLNSRRTPASVQVEPFVGADGAPLQEARAAFLDVLARSDLRPPPAVPGASSKDTLSLLEVNPLSGSWWGTALAFVARIAAPACGWRVTCTLLGADDDDSTAPLGVAVEATHLRTGASVLSGTWWAGSHVEAAQEAGYAVAAAALDDAVLVPEWCSWHREGRGLRAYHQALAMLRSQDDPSEAGGGAPSSTSESRAWEGAYPLLVEAAALEPGNLAVRQELGSCREMRNDSLLALDTYLGIAERCPLAFQSRYRAAIVCGFVRNWAGAWAGTSQPARDQVVDRLRGLGAVGDRHVPAADEREAVVRFFLAAADDLLVRLERSLGLMAHLRHLLAPGRVNDVALLPAGSPLRHLRLAARTARFCVQVKTAPSEQWPALERRVAAAVADKRFRGRIGWQAHYNAACFYSMLLQGKERADESPGAGAMSPRLLAATAVGHLERAVKDPARAISARNRWLREQDPDLRALRSSGTGEFARWLAWTLGEHPQVGDARDLLLTTARDRLDESRQVCQDRVEAWTDFQQRVGQIDSAELEAEVFALLDSDEDAWKTALDEAWTRYAEVWKAGGLDADGLLPFAASIERGQLQHLLPLWGTARDAADERRKGGRQRGADLRRRLGQAHARLTEQDVRPVAADRIKAWEATEAAWGRLVEKVAPVLTTGAPAQVARSGQEQAALAG